MPRLASAVTTLIASVALSGCFVDVDYGGTSYQCADGECPPGYTCVEAMCIEMPGGGDGGVNPTMCGGAAALGFSFDGPLYWGATQQENGATVEQVGGEMVFTMPSLAVGDPDTELRSFMRFDMREDALWVELSEMLNPAVNASAELVLTANWDDYVEFLQEGGELYMKSWINDELQGEVRIPYSATDHRWWRFRETGGRLYWDTSHDGGEWTTRHSIDSPTYMSHSQLYFSAYTWDGIADAGRVVIDNLNGGSAPTQLWCPMASFVDDFDDNSPGLDWNGWANSCNQPTMSNGRIEYAVAANQSADCGFELRSAWRLTDSSFHVEVPSVLNPATNGTTYMTLIDFRGNNAGINIQSGGIGFWLCNPDCNQLSSMTYEPDANRWLRIREDGGELVWETSRNGRDWSEHVRAAPGFTTDQMSVNLGVALPTAHATPGTTIFDNVNVVPE